MENFDLTAYRQTAFFNFLLKVKDYYSWPKYIKQLLFCANLRQNQSQLKFVCFLLVNKYDMPYFLELVSLCNPYLAELVGPEHFEVLNKIIRKYEFIQCCSDHSKYSSYKVSLKAICYLNGNIKCGVNHNRFIDYDRTFVHAFFASCGLDAYDPCM